MQNFSANHLNSHHDENASSSINKLPLSTNDSKDKEDVDFLNNDLKEDENMEICVKPVLGR